MTRRDIYPTLPISPHDSGLASYIDVDAAWCTGRRVS
jgi:hypothetical protein